jgi:FAD/FMN-containing dehydrogenase
MSRRAVLRLLGCGVAAGVAACTTRAEPAPSGSPVGSTSVPTSPTSRPTASLSKLSGQLSRPLLLPGAAGYAAAARLYNPRFDSQPLPAAIARCTSSADVAACVRFAASGGPQLYLRAGGHSYGGWSSGPGLLLDLSGMSSVAVDSSARTARIGAGARLADVYTAVAGAGAALPAGSCPTVGVTGLTLGGGVGVLTRAFGLTCDALQAVEIVTADGGVRQVDARSDSDLFWALHGGGGGSFGAVTALTFALRPAPAVQTFFLEWDFGHAEAVLDAWQSWIGRADPQLWSTCKLLADPQQNSLHATVSGTWIGPASQLDAQVMPLMSAVGPPPTTYQRNSLDYLQAMLLEAGCSGQNAQQCIAAALSPPKRQPFAATSAILTKPLPAAGISTAVAQVRRGLAVPAIVEGGVSFDGLGGLVAEVDSAATAFVHRNALATVQYTATWASMSTSADPSGFDAYVRGERAALMPWTGSAAYVNYVDPAISDYGQAYWGANYSRLRQIKKSYDPANLFRFPQSVIP